MGCDPESHHFPRHTHAHTRTHTRMHARTHAHTHTPINTRAHTCLVQSQESWVSRWCMPGTLLLRYKRVRTCTHASLCGCGAHGICSMCTQLLWCTLPCPCMYPCLSECACLYQFVSLCMCACRHARACARMRVFMCVYAQSQDNAPMSPAGRVLSAGWCTHAHTHVHLRLHAHTHARAGMHVHL